MKPKPLKPKPKLTPEQKEKRKIYLQNNPDKVREWAERAKHRREYPEIF